MYAETGKGEGGYIMEQWMPFIWLGVALVMGVLEMCTAQLVSVWFVFGGIGAAVSCIFTDQILIQLGVFAGVSLVALLVTRPIVKKLKHTPQVATNADMNIGKTVVVITEINNNLSTGEVKIDDVVWPARALDGSVIPAGEFVVVQAIEGIKLMVLPKKVAVTK